MAGNNPNLVDHTISQREFAEGEIAYRRRQAKGPLSWRELIVLGLGAAVVLYGLGSVAWAWLT